MSKRRINDHRKQFITFASEVTCSDDYFAHGKSFKSNQNFLPDNSTKNTNMGLNTFHEFCPMHFPRSNRLMIYTELPSTRRIPFYEKIYRAELGRMMKTDSDNSGSYLMKRMNSNEVIVESIENAKTIPSLIKTFHLEFPKNEVYCNISNKATNVKGSLLKSKKIKIHVSYYVI